MFTQIKKDRDAARKDRDQFTLTTLSTLIGEIETKHRSGDVEFKDVDIATQKVIKKTIVSCQEMYKVKKDEKSLLEIEILERYLPTMMTEAQVVEILQKEQFAELKDVMQFFKKSGAAVDMKMVRELFMKGNV